MSRLLVVFSYLSRLLGIDSSVHYVELAKHDVLTNNDNV